jgi:predicted nucleic acid-binding protein
MSILSPTTALEQLLDLRVGRVYTAPLLGEAWDTRHNVTVADALYVMLFLGASGSHS